MGDYVRMCEDNAALQLATEAVTVEGLTSFQQVLRRAEAVKAARCAIYPALDIEAEYSSDPGSLTHEEFFALIRQFYGNLAAGEMQTIEQEFKAARKVITRDVNRRYNEWFKAYRAKAQQMSAAV